MAATVDLFPNRNRPRSTLDLKVGRFHLVEVAVHLATHRRDASHRQRLAKGSKSKPSSDSKLFVDEWEWYQTHREEIHREFLELMEASVLSRMFGTELEAFCRRKFPTMLPPEDSETGGVASKNLKRGGKRTAGKPKKKSGKPAKKFKGKIGLPADDDDEAKPDKDVYFALGRWIRLAYKRQPLRDDRSSRTLLVQRKNNTHDENGSSKNSSTPVFVDRTKLSHRLLVWIGPSEAAASTIAACVPGAEDAGPYRPEMIPISSLFRTPKEFLDHEFSDDDE